MTLATVTIAGQPRVIDLGKVSRLIDGNFQSYAKNPYSAYTGMWGLNATNGSELTATSSMRVYPETFPKGTVFTWNVTRGVDTTGVVGYLHADWGNYDDSPGSITPKQVSSISTLSVQLDWTFTGDAASGLLSECWLSSASTPSGSPDRLHEVAFFPKVSSSGATYLASLSNVGVGSFTDANSVTWNVRQGTGGTGQPYYIAYRPSYVDFRGVLPYKELFTFLVGAGKIAGTEWLNGLAFGVEPYSGAGSLTVVDFTPTYS